MTKKQLDEIIKRYAQCKGQLKEDIDALVKEVNNKK
jgi:hypothetical protein